MVIEPHNLLVYILITTLIASGVSYPQKLRRLTDEFGEVSAPPPVASSRDVVLYLENELSEEQPTADIISVPPPKASAQDVGLYLKDEASEEQPTIDIISVPPPVASRSNIVLEEATGEHDNAVVIDISNDLPDEQTQAPEHTLNEVPSVPALLDLVERTLSSISNTLSGHDEGDENCPICLDYQIHDTICLIS